MPRKRRGIRLDRLHSHIRTICIQSLHYKAEIFILVSNISNLRTTHCLYKSLFCLWFKWGHYFTLFVGIICISKNTTLEPNFVSAPGVFSPALGQENITYILNLFIDFTSDCKQGWILLPHNFNKFHKRHILIFWMWHILIKQFNPQDLLLQQSSIKGLLKIQGTEISQSVKDVSARTYLLNSAACFFLSGKVAGKGVTLLHCPWNFNEYCFGLFQEKLLKSKQSVSQDTTERKIWATQKKMLWIKI